jgi:hypothetical protein
MPKLPMGLLLAFWTMPLMAAPFEFTPVPRWAEEPETEEKCAVVKAECAAMAAGDSIEADIGYDELYDADGMLVGLRLTKSTGCKVLDEATLLGQRRFKLAFHRAGVPDLDETRLELKPGVNRDDVRIVKAGRTSLSLGCN